MLWCKLLGPLASLWGCPESSTVASGSVIPLEKLMVITEIAQLVAPPPTTVTVTVGVVATPANTVIAVPATYPTATPAARPISKEWDEDFDSELVVLPPSWVKDIFAAADWFENSGFYVTPLLLTKAFFMFMLLNLVCMIAFENFKLPAVTVKLILQGLLKFSKVAWALLFGASLYLVYDTLPMDPIGLVVLELLHSHRKCTYTVVSVCETILSWSREFVPGDRDSMRRQRWRRLRNATDQLMHEGKWAPKTFTELFVGILVGIFRCCHLLSNFCFGTLEKVWDKSGPAVTIFILALPGLVSRFFDATLGTIHAQMTAHGYTWTSPFTWLFITRPLELWGYFKNVRSFFTLLIWTKAVEVPFNIDPELATSWELRDAIVRLSCMSPWDMVKMMMAYDKLKVESTQIENRIREEFNGKVDGTMKSLAERAISWRNSLTAMAIDYNHTRQTLDIFASTMLCIMLKIDPTGPNARQFFNSGRIVTVLTPHPNGLHYSAQRGAAPIQLHVQNKIKDDVVRLLGNCKWNIKMGHGQTYISTMDLYKPDTYCFDLRQMGFHLAPFLPELNPIDLSKRILHGRRYRELEDYCLDGNVVQWYEDMPAREERLRQLEHPFYGGGYGTRF